MKENLHNKTLNKLSAPSYSVNFFQPKLSINQPNDIYEQEADVMADMVMRMPNESLPITGNKPFFSPAIVTTNKINTVKEEPLKKENKEEKTEESFTEIQAKSFDALPPPDENKTYNASFIQRKCTHCEEEEKKVQKKETNNNDAVATTSTESYISSLNGKGKSLSNNERKFFEPKMGYDFSNVQLHTNTEANQSAKNINALAYTHKNNIVFGSGQHKPDTDDGKKLMAHELTHVIQQNKNNLSEKKQNEKPEVQKNVVTSLPKSHKTNSNVRRRNNSSAKIKRRSVHPKNKLTATNVNGKHKSDEIDNFKSKLSERKSISNHSKINQSSQINNNLIFESNITTAQVQSRLNTPTQKNSTNIDLIENSQAKGHAIISQNKNDAEKKVRKKRAQALAVINMHHDRSCGTIHDLFFVQKNLLLAKLLNAGSHIIAGLITHSGEITDSGTNTKNDIGSLFSNHKTAIANIITSKISDTEKMRSKFCDDASNEIHQKADAAIAYGLKSTQYYPDTERGQIQAAYAFQAADQASKDIREREPETIDSINKVIQPIPDTIQDKGDEALNGFDETLPPLLAQIDSNVLEAVLSLSQYALGSLPSLLLQYLNLSAQLESMEDLAIGKIEFNTDKATKATNQVSHILLKTIRDSATKATGLIDSLAQEGMSIEGSVGTTDEKNKNDSGNKISNQIIDAANACGLALQTTTEEFLVHLQNQADAANESDKNEVRLSKTQTDKFETTSGKVIDQFVSIVDIQLIIQTILFVITNIGTVGSIEKQLSDAEQSFSASFDPILSKTKDEVGKKIDEGMIKINEALGMLPDKMSEAASDAGWDYDHPILSTLRDIGIVVAGIIVGILGVLLIVVGIILLAEVAIAGLALLIGVEAATFVVTVVGVTILTAQTFEAYKKRRKIQGVVGAFVGAFADTTGITSIKDAFTKPGLSLFERGLSFGSGFATAASFAFGGKIFKAFKAVVPASVAESVPGFIKNPARVGRFGEWMSGPSADAGATTTGEFKPTLDEPRSLTDKPPGSTVVPDEQAIVKIPDGAAPKPAIDNPSVLEPHQSPPTTRVPEKTNTDFLPDDAISNPKSEPKPDASKNIDTPENGTKFKTEPIASEDGPKRRLGLDEKGKCEVCASPCQDIREKYAGEIDAATEAKIAEIENDGKLTDADKLERLKPIEKELADKKLAQGNVRTPNQINWPPDPPIGSKPPINAPNAAEWRYQRYAYEKFREGSSLEDVLPPDKWMRKYFNPTAEGGRPGRPGGSEQVAAKEVLRSEGIRIVENVEVGGRYPDGVDPNLNPSGGINYYEVGKMLDKGIPEARERVKIDDEIKGMGPNDTITFVDKSNPVNRVTYSKGSSSTNPTSKTF